MRAVAMKRASGNLNMSAQSISGWLKCSAHTRSNCTETRPTKRASCAQCIYVFYYSSACGETEDPTNTRNSYTSLFHLGGICMRLG